jgi:hypothetical protein
MDAPPAITTDTPAADDPRSIDTWTVVCIAVVSYLLAGPIIHEGLGHGLTAALVGARDIQVFAAALRSNDSAVSPEGKQTIAIAGPLASLLAGLLLALCHAHTRSDHAAWRYFLWLTAYVCLFQGAGYFMALSLAPFGDISAFVTGLDHEYTWRNGLTLAGTAVSVVELLFAGRALDEFLGRTRRRARAARLVVISYLAGATPLILAAMLGGSGDWPARLRLTLISAMPATLGGTIFLLYTILAVGPARPTTTAVPLTPGRSLPWYAAGAVALLLSAFAFGPGVPR